MSAAEMRDAAAKHLDSRADDIERDPLAFSGARHLIARVLREEAAAIRALPLIDEEGMVERVARAICEAPPRTVETADGTTVELAGCPEPGACKLCSYGARAAIRAINGSEP